MSEEDEISVIRPFIKRGKPIPVKSLYLVILGLISLNVFVVAFIFQSTRSFSTGNEAAWAVEGLFADVLLVLSGMVAVVGLIGGLLVFILHRLREKKWKF